MDVSFISLVRGNRLGQYVGLTMTEGYEYKHGKDYCYIEIPVLHLETGTGEKVMEGKRQQRLLVVPACTIAPKGAGTHILIEPNRLISEYGDIQPSYYVHNGEPEMRPAFHITLRKDMSVTDIPFAIRLYLRN